MTDDAGLDAVAVERFKQYIRVNTAHPRPDYDAAYVFLKDYATEVGLPAERIDISPTRWVLLMTWEGADPSLPSIVLNSHIDVVPAFPDMWTVDPYGAEEKDGKIYGRGTQDMKSVGIQFMEAVRRLKRAHFVPARTIHVLFVPDEEIGGVTGMRVFVDHPRLTALNIGLVLDEGLASPTDTFTVFYGERKIWWIHVKATGPTGHGSRFIKNSAVEKLMRVANKLLEFRAQQLGILEASCGCGKKLGDVTTVNLTGLEAGVAGPEGIKWSLNVVPTTAEAGFDCRIPATVDLTEFKAQLDEWTSEEGVSYNLIAGTSKDALTNPTTPVSESSFWWRLFQQGAESAGIAIEPGIFPASTDSRFLRAMGYPAFGFSPMNNTPILLHDHDEFLGVDVFCRGITILQTIVQTLASNKEPATA